MSSKEVLDKIRDLLVLWRGRQYEQLAALVSTVLIAVLVYVIKEKEIPIIGSSHHTLVIIVVSALIVLCVGFLTWRLGRLGFPSQEEVPQKLLPSAVRGPLPFVETDGPLFLRLGRRRVLQDLLALTFNEEIPVIVVSGESGAGKTSLLRAGLGHVLKEQYARTCVYWDARPTSPVASLLTTLQAACGGSEKVPALDRVFDASPNSHLVVIIDQLEQLSPTKEDHRPIFDLIAAAAHRNSPHPITWIIGFKKQFGADWYEFQSDHALNPSHVSVKLFNEAQAEEVMATLGAAASVTFERELLEDFIHSASIDGLVSPVDISIGTLVLVNLAERTNKDILRIGDYNFAGGSTGVLTAYLQDRISIYPDTWRQEILKILLELIDGDQRRPEGRSLAFLSEKTNLTKARLTNIAEELAAPSVRVLEKLPEDPSGSPQYRLPHERLVSPIRILSGSILAAADRARLTLEAGYRTWVRSHNPKYLLSGGELALVRRYPTMTTGDFAQELSSYLQLSVKRRRLRMIVTTILSLAAISLLAALTIRIDWQVQEIANHWPPGEDGLITMEPMPQGDTMFTGLFWGLPYAHLWDVHTGKVILSVHGNAFSLGPRGRYLLIASADEKQLQALDLTTKARFKTPFPYEGDGSLTEVQFGESGEVIFHSEETGRRPDTFNAIATLKMWSLASQKDVGTISGINIGGERSYSLLDNRNRLIASVRVGNRIVPGIWDTKTNHALGLLTKHESSQPSYALDEKHGRIAVVEKANENQNAVELWDLETGKFIRERLIDREKENQPEHHHHGSFIGLSVTFLRGGSFLLLGGAETEPSVARLVNADDLSDNASSGVPRQRLWLIESRFLVWSSDSKSTSIWDSEKNTTSRIAELPVDEIKQQLFSPDFATMIVMTQKGSVERCTLTSAATCTPVIDQTTALFKVLGSDSFGIRTKEGSISVFGFDGIQRAYLPKTYLGDSFEISFDSKCKRALGWAQDGRVLQYKRRWTVFGKGVKDVTSNCNP